MPSISSILCNLILVSAIFFSLNAAMNIYLRSIYPGLLEEYEDHIMQKIYMLEFDRKALEKVKKKLLWIIQRSIRSCDHDTAILQRISCHTRLGHALSAKSDLYSLVETIEAEMSIRQRTDQLSLYERHYFGVFTAIQMIVSLCFITLVVRWLMLVYIIS